MIGYTKVMWQELAECRGADLSLFFPREKRKRIVAERDRIANAKKLCARCVVKQDCLEWAILHDSTGIWGGLDTNERHAHIRRLPGTIPAV